MRLIPNAQSCEQLNSTWRGHILSPDTRSAYDKHASSPASAGSKFISGAGVAAVFAFFVGTGGLLTAVYVAERNDRGYRFNEFEYETRLTDRSQSRAKVRSSLENLGRIRE